MNLSEILTKSSINKMMRIAYRHKYAGKTIASGVKIVFHGLGGHSDSETIKPVINYALESNYDVISVDWPFHGCSSLVFQQKPTLEDMMITIEEILAYASKLYNSIDLIGHSMGSLFLIYWGCTSSNKHSLINSVVAMNPGFPKIAFYQEWLVRLISLIPAQYGHSIITHTLAFTDDVLVVEKRFQDPLELKYIQDIILLPLFDASKYIINNIEKQQLTIKVIWSNSDPIINVSNITQLFKCDKYINYYHVDLPYHELCTTKCVGEIVCKKAVGEPLKKKIIEVQNNTTNYQAEEEVNQDDICQDDMYQQIIIPQCTYGRNNCIFFIIYTKSNKIYYQFIF